MKFKIGFAVVFGWIVILCFMMFTHHMSVVSNPDTSVLDIKRHLSNNSTRDSGVTKVLLLTYMRSGSSLTGDILQHSPGAFYVYEPLRVLGRMNPEEDLLDYVNGTVRSPPFDFKDEAADIFKNWFTCNITNLPSFALKDKHFLGMGLKTRLFHDCLKDETRQTVDTSVTFQSCVKDLQRRCEESPVRIIKTIRVEVSTIKHLFKEMPNLKMIHLVRDPRATLFSQAHVGRCSIKLGGYPGCISKYCTRMENDVLEEERLKHEHPDRIMTAFYENIARHPIEASREMYDFCGADFTENSYRYVHNITMAGNPDNCIICTVRSNSSEHIDTWRQKMSSKIVNMIQERCNYILRRYRYI